MMVRPPILVPVQSVEPLTPVQSSGPSVLTFVILAAVGYGGYRVYKHFRKG